MSDLDRYIPGVPCWVDTSQPDPEAAARFYGGLFGWELENAMPPGAGGAYLMARLGGEEVAAVSSIPAGAPPMATWNTYVLVESADATVATARDAGGTVVMEPFDIPEAGRMAVLADPEGAVFCVWQAGRHRGASMVNAPGSLNFNGLNTRDAEGARAFYGAVLGWQVLDVRGAKMWTLPAYGDHLEQRDPGMRDRMAEVGAPDGFESVVASINPIPADQPDVPAHWSVTFAVQDADATAAKASELGGTVVVPPFDAPWVRMTVLADPAGASFIASRFVPENRDVEVQADSTAPAA